MRSVDEIDSLLSGLESLRAYLGTDWVNREVEAVVAARQGDTSGGRGRRHRFHPAVDLFAKARHHIDHTPPPVPPTHDLIRLGLLGQQVSLLERAGVPGTADKIALLRSNNWDLFSSTAFEIEIAALHVGIGRHVEFLREGPQKTPDLLVDSEIEIECKSVRQLTQRDQNNREMWSQLERKLWNATRGDSGWYVEFETEDVVRQEDLAWVLEQLGKAQGECQEFCV